MRIENGVSNVQAMPSNAVKEESSNKESSKMSNLARNHSLQTLTHKPQTQLSMDEQQWIKLIERANKALNGGNRSFEFSIHEGTNEIMVKVIDNDTKEVIREIPNEKILDMVAKMWEMAGIFVDERR